MMYSDVSLRGKGGKRGCIRGNMAHSHAPVSLLFLVFAAVNT